MKVNIVGNGSEGDGDRNKPTNYPIGERDKYHIGNDRIPPGKDRYPNRNGQHDRFPMNDYFGNDGFPISRPGYSIYDQDRFLVRNGPYSSHRRPMGYIPDENGIIIF